MIAHRSERGTSASDFEPQRRVYCEISHRLERGTTTSENACPKGVDCEILHWLEGGTKHFFYKGVETSI